MSEQEMMQRVKNAEPMADMLAKIPAASRDMARIAMQSFSAGFLAGSASQQSTATPRPTG